jgi:hypothetical protein
MGYDFRQRSPGAYLADAATKPSALSQSDKRSDGFSELGILREGVEEIAALSRYIQSTPGQFQK